MKGSTAFGPKRLEFLLPMPVAVCPIMAGPGTLPFPSVGLGPGPRLNAMARSFFKRMPSEYP